MSEMRFFKVKNYEQFQHYKDRNPPWIKLYNELLDDYEFGLLQDASKFHLIAIWLLASRSENKIPFDIEWVSRRINATSPVDLDDLNQRGFIIINQELQGAEQIASTTLARCSPETEHNNRQSRAEPDTRDDLKIRTGNFQQAIVRAFADGNSPNLPETSRASLWLTQGYQEDICLAVVTELVRKKPSITTLNYFDNAIREAHASKAPPRQAVPMTAEEVNWDDVLTTFKKIGHWSKWAGPDLASPACRAPPEMLAKYGLTLDIQSNSAPAISMRAMQ